MFHPLLANNKNVMPAKAMKEVVLLDRGYNTTCAINLYGATVVSWRIDNVEQLFISRQSVFNNQHDVQGGISFIFPWHDSWPLGPDMGFARMMHWRLVSPPILLASGDVHAKFSLTDDEFSHSMWNYKFKLIYNVTLFERTLQVDLTLENTSEEFTLYCELSCNCYFRVPDTTKCQIFGLDKMVLLDNSLTDKIPVNMKFYNNNICPDASQNIIIQPLDSDDDPKIKLTLLNMPEVFLWNPCNDPLKHYMNFAVDEIKKFKFFGCGQWINRLTLLPSQIFLGGFKIELLIKQDEINWY